MANYNFSNIYWCIVRVWVFGNITHQQKDIMKEIKLKNSLNNSPSNTWLFIFGLVAVACVVTFFKIQ